MPTLWEFANEEAQRQGVDPRLVTALMHTESRGRANARSPAGAYGPMQLMPATAKELGVDINDPQDNIRGGIRYLSQQLRRFGGDPTLAAAAYNAGPGAVQKYGGVPPYKETQNYVRKINGLLGTSAAAPQQEPPMPKHGIDIDPSWLESASEPAAKSPVSARAAVASGPQQTAIDPSWLEPVAGPATQKAAPAAAPRRGLGDSIKEALSVASPINYDVPETGGQKRWVVSPTVGGGLRGLAAIPILADRLGAKIQSAVGGKPNPGFADDLEQAIASRTAAPRNALEVGTGKVNEFIGGGVAGGKVIGGIGKLAGAGRVGRALQSAGAITPASVGASVTGGAAANAADELIGKKLESPIARTAVGLGAGILGGVPGASLMQRAGGVARNAEAAAAVQTAREAGIPVQASDLSPTVAKIKQGIVDKVPFGNLTAGRVPTKQVEGVQRELREVAERYRPADLDPGAGTTGADRYIAKDLRSGYQAAKAEANAAYKQVDDAMRANPELPPIDLAATRGAVKTVLDEFPKAFRDLTLSSSAKRALGVLKAGTKPAEPLKTIKVGDTVIDLEANPSMRAALEAAGIKTTTEAPKIGLAEARTLASELHELAGGAKRAAVAGGGSQKQAGTLEQLAAAVSRDVDAYMASAPDDIKQAYANADKVFRERVLPYRADPKVRKLVSSKTPQTDFDTEAQGLYGNLFNTSQGERSAMALGLMSDKGKQAAAYQALKEAGEKGLSNTGPEGLKAVSASRALDVEGNPALANIADNYPALAQEAERLRSLLQVGRSASAALGRKSAATGIQNMPLLSGGLLAAGGNQVGQALGNMPLGYGIMVGMPIAGANAFNLANRLGAGAIARGGATATERTVPGLVQGALAEDDEPKRKKKSK